jgi:hypothetical protein
MSKKNVHVVKHEGGWAAKKEGAARASVVTTTQSQAIDAGHRPLGNTDSSHRLTGDTFL